MDIISSCEGSTCIAAMSNSSASSSSLSVSLHTNDNNEGVTAARFRRKLQYILLLDVDEERQEKVRVRLQECACSRCSRLLYEDLDYSYDGYDSDYDYYESLSDNDYGCEEEGEAADFAENYERQHNKRNKKTSNQKELRRIKVTGKNSSKNPRSRFKKNAVAARAAKRDEQIALGAEAAERRNTRPSPTLQWDRRLVGRGRHRYRCSTGWPEQWLLHRHRREYKWPKSWRCQCQHHRHEQQYILPAEHLLGDAGGDNADAMYQRLLEISNGAEITPEDYDLLLLLDENNVRSTLQVSQVEQFELLVIDDNVKDDSENDGKQITTQPDTFNDAVPVAVSHQSLGVDSLCLICLQHFAQLENGFELRRLPCQHVYCRSCIEPWLAEFDAKCPDLSCFWNNNDNKSETNHDAQDEENEDNTTIHEGFSNDETNTETETTSEMS